MRILFLLYLSLISVMSFSQDIDIYKKTGNTEFKLPNIPNSMSVDEFQLLSRNTRMIDMLHAVVVPGHIHFKAKSPLAGYTLLTLRSLAYIGLLDVYAYKKLNGENLINLNPFSNSSEPAIVVNDNWQIETTDIIATVSAVVIVGTYLYDWIHGKQVLERKQELIRYKYSVKFKLENSHKTTSNSYIPAMGVAIHF